MSISTVNVEIVRPKTTFLGSVITLLGRYFIGALIVMFILGTITELHVGYWHSVLFVWLVRVLMADGDYLVWTKAAK